MTTELLDAPKSAVAEYQPFYAQLAQLEKDNAALAFDYESKKGNKEARSHVNTLRLTKGALERTRKEAKEESLRIGRAINARIEAMIVVHQAKLDEIEQREKDRIAALELRLLAFAGHLSIDDTVQSVKDEIAKIEGIAIDDSWQEFAVPASKAKDAALAQLRTDLAAYEKREAEAAELARLRAEAEARAQADRDAAIAAAAAEKARVEAEQRAAAEAQKAAQAIAAAEAKANQQREDAERKELELKLQIERAEISRIQTERKAIDDAKEAAAKAEADKQRAIQDEKDRVAAQARAEAEAQAKREANTAHKKKINRAALAALIAGGISEECGIQCITLIASGKVPAIQVNY